MDSTLYNLLHFIFHVSCANLSFSFCFMSNKTVRCIHCIAFDIPRIKNHFEIEWVLSMRCVIDEFSIENMGIYHQIARGYFIRFTLISSGLWQIKERTKRFMKVWIGLGDQQFVEIDRNLKHDFLKFLHFFSSHHKTNVISQCLRLCLCPTCTFLLPHSRWPKRDCKKQSKKSQF